MPSSARGASSAEGETGLGLLALTREVSPSIGRCQLTHLAREPIDVGTARRQHQAYERCLEGLGCEVRRLPAEPDLPDSVFVEDTAIVLDELAIVTRPGAESRRPETASVARALGALRELRFIAAPGTLDGGDVLQLDRRLLVGASSRSDRAGIEQLRAHVAPFGYRVDVAEVKGCLHLKSAMTRVARNTLLANPSWVDVSRFAEWSFIDVDPAEPFAANALLLREEVVFPAAHPRTRARLERHGLRVETVDVSELARAEGGVTCCSLIVRV